MRTYGVFGLQHHVRNIISIGEHFASLIKSRPDLFTIIVPPAFALTVFVVNTVNGGGAEERNKLTKTVYESINEEGKIFITSGVVDDIYMIRVIGASSKTRKEHLERAFGIIVEMAEKVRGEKEEYKNADVGEVGEVQLRGL
ncbi:uncharacterized protein LAJ45_10973 [Morchella importuna]|nr:uncharacterized protein LAJ45_10973 [Morchella importuna]KAH8145062.1 hypothetical protein LAJ45_10973 [Morchella importuna]